MLTATLKNNHIIDVNTIYKSDGHMDGGNIQAYCPDTYDSDRYIKTQSHYQSAIHEHIKISKKINISSSKRDFNHSACNTPINNQQSLKLHKVSKAVGQIMYKHYLRNNYMTCDEESTFTPLLRSVTRKVAANSSPIYPIQPKKLKKKYYHYEHETWIHIERLAKLNSYRQELTYELNNCLKPIIYKKYVKVIRQINKINDNNIITIVQILYKNKVNIPIHYLLTSNGMRAYNGNINRNIIGEIIVETTGLGDQLSLLIQNYTGDEPYLTFQKLNNPSFFALETIRTPLMMDNIDKIWPYFMKNYKTLLKMKQYYDSTTRLMQLDHYAVSSTYHTSRIYFWSFWKGDKYMPVRIWSTKVHQVPASWSSFAQCAMSVISGTECIEEYTHKTQFAVEVMIHKYLEGLKAYFYYTRFFKTKDDKKLGYRLQIHYPIFREGVTPLYDYDPDEQTLFSMHMTSIDTAGVKLKPFYILKYVQFLLTHSGMRAYNGNIIDTICNVYNGIVNYLTVVKRMWKREIRDAKRLLLNNVVQNGRVYGPGEKKYRVSRPHVLASLVWATFLFTPPIIAFITGAYFTIKVTHKVENFVTDMKTSYKIHDPNFGHKFIFMPVVKICTFIISYLLTKEGMRAYNGNILTNLRKFYYDYILKINPYYAAYVVNDHIDDDTDKDTTIVTNYQEIEHFTNYFNIQWGTEPSNIHAYFDVWSSIVKPYKLVMGDADVGDYVLWPMKESIQLKAYDGQLNIHCVENGWWGSNNYYTKIPTNTTVVPIAGYTDSNMQLGRVVEYKTKIQNNPWLVFIRAGLRTFTCLFTFSALNRMNYDLANKKITISYWFVLPICTELMRNLLTHRLKELYDIQLTTTYIKVPAITTNTVLNRIKDFDDEAIKAMPLDASLDWTIKMVPTAFAKSTISSFTGINCIENAIKRALANNYRYNDNLNPESLKTNLLQLWFSLWYFIRKVDINVNYLKYEEIIPKCVGKLPIPEQKPGSWVQKPATDECSPNKPVAWRYGDCDLSDYIFFGTCTHNSYAACVNRQTPKLPLPNAAALRDFSNFIHSNFDKFLPIKDVTIMPREAWLVHLRSSQKKMYQAMLKFHEGKYMPKNKFEKKGMVKIEWKYKPFQKIPLVIGPNKIIDEPKNEIPRCIMGGTPEFTYNLGPYIKTISDIFSAVWCGGRDLECNWCTIEPNDYIKNLTYASGMTRDELGKWFGNIVNKFKNPIFYEDDYKKFDSSKVNEILKLEFKKYEYILGPDSSEMLEQLYTEQFKKGVMRCNDKTCIKFFLHGTTGSGEPNTSSGNGSTNLDCSSWCINQQYDVCELLKQDKLAITFGGDDKGMIFDDIELDEDRWKKDMLLLGMQCSLELVSKVDFKFLQGYFVPCYGPDGPQYLHTMIPGRILKKAFICLTNYNRLSDQKAWLKAVCIGYLHDLNHIPFMRRWFNANLKRLENVEAMQLEHDQYKFNQQFKYEETMETYSWLCEHYGFTISEIDTLGGLLEMEHIDWGHPLIKQIYAVDLDGNHIAKPNRSNNKPGLKPPVNWRSNVVKLQPYVPKDIHLKQIIDNDPKMTHTINQPKKIAQIDIQSEDGDDEDENTQIDNDNNNNSKYKNKNNYYNGQLKNNNNKTEDWLLNVQCFHCYDYGHVSNYCTKPCYGCGTYHIGQKCMTLWRNNQLEQSTNNVSSYNYVKTKNAKINFNKRKQRFNERKTTLKKQGKQIKNYGDNSKFKTKERKVDKLIDEVKQEIENKNDEKYERDYKEEKDEKLDDNKDNNDNENKEPYEEDAQVDNNQYYEENYHNYNEDYNNCNDQNDLQQHDNDYHNGRDYYNYRRNHPRDEDDNYYRDYYDKYGETPPARNAEDL